MIAVRGLVHHLSSFGSRPSCPSSLGERGQQKSQWASSETVLCGVDLELEQGEIVLLLGRNGSGKTTLAYYLAGLLIPSEGIVTIDGIPTHQREVLPHLRRRVGLLFQESQDQIIAQTPLEDVAFGLENLALDPAVIREQAWTALERVGLRDKALRPIEALTPAERQHLALAGLLAMNPEYYILDEPDRTADRDGLKPLLSVVWELRSQQKGVLIISHKEFWSEHVDRVVRLEGGKVYDLHPGCASSRAFIPSPFGGRGEQGVRVWRGNDPQFCLQAQNLSFAYEKSTPQALQDFSAEITAGEFIVITGAAGSGKSTLVELLAGLAPPTSGSVLWNGTPLSSLKAAERVRCVGLVFQEARKQLLGESVKEEIIVGLHAQGYSQSESERRARWACEAVGLDWERCQDQPAHLLSGGEQARLAMAAVMALNPKVLILDETLSALDPTGQSELLALLYELYSQGKTVLLVSSEDYAKLGTRLWRLERGRLAYDGPP